MRFQFLAFIPLLFLITACPSNEVNDGSTDRGPAVDDRAAKLANESHFNNTIKPILETRCISCHGFPRSGGNATGPLSIYSYTAMQAKLISGGTTDNELMEYTRGTGDHAGHAGGTDFCSGSLGNLPCLELLTWCEKEGCSSAGGSGGNSPPAGRVDRVSSRGVIEGWARDFDQRTTPVNVEIYADGVSGVGSFLGTTVANRAYASIDASGNIGFQYQIPENYKNGSSHTYYIYAQDSQSASTYAQVSGSPKTVTLYSPRSNAESLYNSSVLPLLTSRCGSCHGRFEYSSMFYDFFLNSSGNPSGATTHSLYQRISGAVSHTGGTHCGGADNLCPKLQTVYSTQFN